MRYQNHSSTDLSCLHSGDNLADCSQARSLPHINSASIPRKTYSILAAVTSHVCRSLTLFSLPLDIACGSRSRKALLRWSGIPWISSVFECVFPDSQYHWTCGLRLEKGVWTVLTQQQKACFYSSGGSTAQQAWEELRGSFKSKWGEYLVICYHLDDKLRY